MLTRSGTASKLACLKTRVDGSGSSCVGMLTVVRNLTGDGCREGLSIVAGLSYSVGYFRCECWKDIVWDADDIGGIGMRLLSIDVYNRVILSCLC